MVNDFRLQYQFQFLQEQRGLGLYFRWSNGRTKDREIRDVCLVRYTRVYPLSLSDLSPAGSLLWWFSHKYILLLYQNFLCKVPLGSTILDSNPLLLWGLFSYSTLLKGLLRRFPLRSRLSVTGVSSTPTVHPPRVLVPVHTSDFLSNLDGLLRFEYRTTGSPEEILTRDGVERRRINLGVGVKGLFRPELNWVRRLKDPSTYNHRKDPGDSWRELGYDSWILPGSEGYSSRRVRSLTSEVLRYQGWGLNDVVSTDTLTFYTEQRRRVGFSLPGITE